MFNDEGRYGQITDWVQLMYGAFSGPRYVDHCPYINIVQNAE